MSNCNDIRINQKYWESGKGRFEEPENRISIMVITHPLWELFLHLWISSCDDLNEIWSRLHNQTYLFHSIFETLRIGQHRWFLANQDQTFTAYCSVLWDKMLCSYDVKWPDPFIGSVQDPTTCFHGQIRIMGKIFFLDDFD